MSKDCSIIAQGRSTNGGQVQVFESFGGELSQMGQTIQGDAPGDFFTQLSLSGDGLTIAVGSSGLDTSAMGKVHVYEYIDNMWAKQTGSIEEVGREGTSTFASDGQLTLSADGKTLAVGDFNHNNQVGYAAVYKYNGSSWIKVQDFVHEAESMMGHTALSDDGNVLAIGCKGSKVVYIYEYTSTQYEEVKEIRSDMEEFGSSVSLSQNGTTLAVGAPGFDNSRGAAVVYEDNNGAWEQKGNLLVGTSSGEKFASALSLSNDGNTVSAGSSLYDSSKGRLQMFKYSSDFNSWDKMGTDIVGKKENDKLFDHGFSGDGLTLFTGSLSGDYLGTFKMLQDRRVYPPTCRMLVENDELSVYHLIGDKPPQARVTMYETECNTKADNEKVAAITVQDYKPQEHKFEHNIKLSKTDITENNRLVKFDNITQFGLSKGAVTFCTRVETFLETSRSMGDDTEIIVTRQETNYRVKFDLTAGDAFFALGGTTIKDDADTQSTTLDTNLKVEACRCKPDAYECLADDETNIPIQQNSRIYVCLYPDNTDLRISNFELSLKAGTFSYTAVEFGIAEWETDALTEVEPDTSSDWIRVSAFIVAGLFADEEAQMTVSGNAFMEFKDAATRMLEFYPYGIQVPLATPDEECTGFFSKILNLLL